MKAWKVFVCEHLHDHAISMLEQEAEILSDMADLRYADAVITRNLRLDRAFLVQCPNLKVIGIHGTGTDGVDLAEAKRRGISVVSTPGENARSVAELIVAYALLLYRQIPQFDRMLQNRQPVVNGGGEIVGRELTGKTFGMIGCGRIACLAAKQLQAAFQMDIIGYSPSLTEEKAASLGVQRCSTPEAVFEQADIVNIGISLKPETVGFISRRMLSHAKKGCVLLNTSRGSVIDEAALYDALTDGTLSAAACDVFIEEPPSLDNPLLTLPNFLATPHIGANTEEALERVGCSVVRQILAVLQKDKMDSLHLI